jgi:hypothetical protein
MADTKISALTAATTPLAGTEVLPIVQSGVTKQVSVANLTAGRAVAVASLSATTGPVAVNSSGGYAQFTPDVGALTGGYGANNTARQWLAGGTGNNTNQVGHYVKSVMTGNGGGGGTASLQFGQLAWSGTAFTEGTAQFTLDKDGNWVIGTAAKGVNFTANTPAAGMTSQLLNWYEEGTWTPNDASGAGLTLTVLANSAKYTRVGRMVTATFAVSYPSTASALQAAIGGLPFTSGTGAGQGGYVVYTSLANIPGLNVSPSSTIFYIYGGGGTGLSNTNMSTQDLRGVVVYFV